MPSDNGDSTTATRRNFLTVAGGVGAAGLAGCITEPSGPGTDGTGGNDGTDGGLSGEVVITGSSTVFPISDAMAEQFMQAHPEVNVTVDSTGSGGGFENHFCPGDSDVNGASRPIKDSEVEKCQRNDVEPVEFHVAGDALTMAVNNEADWVDCMTFDELSQVWREDGAQKWSDVRDDWPDEAFELFGPASTSGTYDWFNENVVGEDHAHTSSHEPTEDDNLIVQGIEDSTHAMGYFGYAYYSESSDRVKAVKIKEAEGDECTEPSLANAKDGSYPMARPLFIYPSEEAIQREVVYEFLNFYLEEAETDLVQEIGYVPSSEQMRDDNLDKLDGIAGT
jgi:phosphate transport system substrate-binding protein